MQKTIHLPYSSDVQHAEDKRILNVFLPDESNGCCIFFIHGGGWYAGSPEQWTSVAEHFCDRGYVCVSAGYRLCPEFQFPLPFEDVRLAYSFVKARADEWKFDPNGMAVWGSSAGGHLAAMLATTASDDVLGYSAEMTVRDTRPAAGVYCCPVFSVLPSAGTDVLEAEIKFLGGEPKDNLELARSASPIVRLSEETPPMLIIQGDADDCTPLAHQEMMLDECAWQGVKAEMVVLPGVGHGFGYGVGSEAQKRMLESAEGFLERFLATAFRTLIDVIKRCESLRAGDIIYIQGGQPWNAKSLCAVLSENEMEDPDETPPFALEHNLTRTLARHETQDVVSNARQQKEFVSDDELVRAFNFYFERDAFIELARF